MLGMRRVKSPSTSRWQPTGSHHGDREFSETPPGVTQISARNSLLEPALNFTGNPSNPSIKLDTRPTVTARVDTALHESLSQKLVVGLFAAVLEQ